MTSFLAGAARCAALALLSMASTSWADSLASSASSAGSASLGSISDSSKGSSKSSTGGTKVAEGDYKVIDVATLAGQPGMLRVKLQAAATPVDLRGAPGSEPGTLWLTLPAQALAHRALLAGDVVNASNKPYGLAFAYADSGHAFFLLLADDWRGDIDAQAVTL